ncbi:MAG: terminase family protein [Clostridia bacterium]|jgi:phage terminase large subunit-like protein|nr:terminase family protein [Clostridia bacterium]MDD4408289.1 terminase family protein [Clostridia bacterium]
MIFFSKKTKIYNKLEKCKLREVVNQILKIENILKTRNQTNSKLKKYNKGSLIHKKQMQFHKCKKRNRWVFGGNRSGKTECGAVETVWLARGIHPYKENKKNISGWIVSLSHQVQRDVAQNKILEYINPYWIKEVVMREGRKSSAKYGIIDFILIKNVFGGASKLAFKSCDQGREKFQGTSLDFVWFDEEPPQDIYRECQMRVMDKKGEIFGTMTPLKGLTWVYDEIYLNQCADSEVWSIFMEWNDNPFLNKEEITHLTQTLSSDELESRRYGRFIHNGGLVYGEFDPSIHIIEPFNVPTEWYDNISIDPGLNNPLSAHWYAEDFDGNIYVIAEHYEARQTVLYHASKIKEICQTLNWPLFQGKVRALIDSASNQRTLAGEKSVSELFNDCGILVSTSVNKDLFSGINKVKWFLKDVENKTRLFIFKSCVNLIREIKGYSWGNGEKPMKKNDHALDELRYYLMSKNSRTEKPNKTEIQKNKEKLIRKIKNTNF